MYGTPNQNPGFDWPDDDDKLLEMIDIYEDASINDNLRAHQRKRIDTLLRLARAEARRRGLI